MIDIQKIFFNNIHSRLSYIKRAIVKVSQHYSLNQKLYVSNFTIN
jgi:hypothetical protein